MPTLEILSQGEEIVTGQVVDTNAAWLAQQTVEMGFKVTRTSTVGDKLNDLVNILQEISQRADCCLCTGGLGPTGDDLTAEAVATAFGVSLALDDIALSQIQRYFEHRNRPMADCNWKQALLPTGSRRLDNAKGTAPGFALQAGRCWFVFMPGVPGEMKHMFTDSVRPQLQQQFVLQPAKLVVIRTLGIGESDLQEKINEVVIPASVQLGFRAEPGEVQVKLLFPDNFATLEIEQLTGIVAAKIGEAVYAIDKSDSLPSNLVAIIDGLMLAKGQNLALIETVSHGLVASKLLGVSWLRAASVELSDSKRFGFSLIDWHRVDLCAVIQEVGAKLTAETAAEMLLIQLGKVGDQQNLANNGITRICTGLFNEGKLTCLEHNLAGDIQRKQHQAAMIMLDVLRRSLQNTKK